MNRSVNTRCEWEARLVEAAVLPSAQRALPHVAAGERDIVEPERERPRRPKELQLAAHLV